MSGYSDAKFQTNRDNFFLQSGWVLLLNGGAVTWKSSKQKEVNNSTCELKYVTTYEGGKGSDLAKEFQWSSWSCSINARTHKIFM